ncbi:xanthine dehydrogenase family protein subunit M [Halobacteriales archaeon QS_8_69_26]|nr:MAG: xanthine dehydrogenase family protein subunit M [Halobacteriales archaeon QS_8_69_26]
MYPGEFDYHEAESVDHALELMDEHSGAETELLAGGHSLLPTMKSGLADPDVVIDIGDIDALSGIDDHGDSVSIGATTTYATIADSETVWNAAPALADAAAHVGDRQVRNCGTIGGNIAHADPASDLPGAALASDATMTVTGQGGKREVDADDFFMGMYMTDVQPGELLTRVEVPKAEEGAGAYAKKPSPSSGYAMVGVAATLRTDGDTVQSAGVGANGAMDHGVRLGPVEDALSGVSLDDEDAMAEAASRATDDLDTAMMMEDIQASADFRAHLLEVYTERALATAADRAGGSAAAGD